MRSAMSVIVENILRLSMAKQNYIGEERVEKYIEKCRRKSSKPYKLSPLSVMKSKAEKRVVNGTDVYYISSKSSTKHYALYFHGGSFMEQPLPPHFWFVDRIARKTDTTVVFPIYPKAPEHDYRETYELAVKLYKELLEKTDSSNILIMGDSSGGGFAISFAMYLRESGLPQPGKVITFSPWLDMTMENEDITEKDKKHDPQLGLDGLRGMGARWANGTDRHNYMLSPMFGDPGGLCELVIFVGTGELFIRDARKFKALAEKSGAALKYFEYPKMNHVFVVFPIPEAAKAQAQVFEIINSMK